MSDQNEIAYQPPSDPAERKKIKEAIDEIVGAMQFISDKRSFISDAKKMLKENYQMPPKVVTRIAKARADNSYDDMAAEDTVFEITYETIFSDSGN